jgi:hypothetical protein
MAIIGCVPLPTACRRSTVTSSRSTTIRLLWPSLGLAPLMLAVLLGLAGCGGDDILLPSSGQPAKIEVLRGDGQTGTVGQPLDSAIVVSVTDLGNRPVEGVEVVFVLPAGAEIVPNDTVLTNADGQATVQYTLGTASGAQVVQTRATPVVPSPSLSTTFTAMANPEAAVALVLADGDGQTGPAGVPLRDSLVVSAEDRFGNGVPGVEVTWQASSGSVTPASVVTDASGRAAAQRTLGDRTGTYRTIAVASGLNGSPITFTATALPNQLALTTQPSATAQVGVAFAQQPELQLQDPFGLPLTQGNVRVSVAIASGGGSLGGTNFAESDASGRVQFHDLSIRGNPGTRTLIFAADGFSSVTSSDIVLAAGPPAPNQSTASVGAGAAGAVTEISIQLMDEFGTPVEGAAASIAVTVDGANPLGGLAVSDRGNGAYSASYTPIRTGTDNVDVRVSGTPLAGSPFASVVVSGAADPSTTTAEFSRGGFVGTILSVLVTARDAHGNAVGRGGDQVQVQQEGGSPRSALDRGNGQYTDAFFVGFGPVSIAIQLNGVPIAGSPFSP